VNKELRRNQYLEKILEFKNSEFIKIITGVRRSGKSTILEQLSNELSDNKNEILFLRFDSLEYSGIRTFDKLFDLINKKLTADIKYILLDEIQLIDGWENLVNGLFAEKKYDIYITGSNSKMLSGELRTLLSGRTISFFVQPFSFKEFLSIRPEYSFDDYLKIGGFPQVLSGGFQGENAGKIVDDIYNTILVKDIIERYKIRNIELFNRVVQFVITNIGNIFSANSISKFLKSEKRNIGVETIYVYLTYLEEAYLVNKVKRYDVKGKEILKTNEKFYLVDHSFATTQGNYNKYISGALENIVFNELLNRGWQMNIGQISDKEIDFIATKKDEKLFIQVSYLMEQDETFNRELSALQEVNTAYPKIILTLDKTRLGNYEGIRCIYLPDWLLSELHKKCKS
jgi:predicted AAA+ superfamily ATPase